MLCHFDRMYVRIKKEVFNSRDAYKYLKLGNCPVNQGTTTYYYLLYLLRTDCGFRTENTPDFVLITNTLRYEPTGVVLREMPFQIPLRCELPRFFHSYKVGFHPKLQGGTIFKALQPKSSFTLSPQDASGNEITGTRTYTLGEEMFFEAKQPGGALSSSQRIYINKCFMTASQDPKSSPKYTFIDNQGCMIDGKVTPKSKFLAGTSKLVLKFKVVAVIFKDLVSASSAQQFYMHCEIAVGTLAPTPTSKACNYRPDTNAWEELYGDNLVCRCCSSTCMSSSPRASGNVISSHSWKVNMGSKDEQDDPWKSSETPFSWEESGTVEHEDLMSLLEQDD
ncbi:zona pellucida sperm-binding protein 3 [Pempheris klunzingeri]|uniref:zona pellucida sperm-binding protein 3 n=1 Tax=Pempheris klunzingeri TaxID=3127111 RepID=UPI003980056D